MSSHELIKDLEKKLGTYEHAHPHKPDSILDAHSPLADLILKADIYPPLLTREVVRQLLEDQEPWPVGESGPYCLAYPVNLGELEASRAVSFPSGTLSMLWPVELNADMPRKLRHQLGAIQFLYDIRTQADGLLRPQLTLTLDDVDEQAQSELAPYLERKGVHFKVSIEAEDIFGVGTCLWERLRLTKQTVQAAFAEYAVRMTLASDRSYVFDIDLTTNEEEESFLEAAFNFIESNQHLREDWSTCAKDVALAAHRLDSIISLHPVSTAKVGTPDATRIYADELDLSQLNDVVCSLMSRPHDTFLQACEWWRNTSNYGYDWRRNICEHVVWLIIRRERNVYSHADSFPLTKRLIELSSSAPRLIGILRQSTSYPPLICFLLSNHLTSHIGLIDLYHQLQGNRPPISQKTNYEKLWNELIWTQALEIFSNAFPPHMDGRDLQQVIHNLCEMVEWFVKHELGYNSRGKSINDTRLPSLRRAIESISVDLQGYSRKGWFSANIAGFVEVIQARPISFKSDLGRMPLGEWLVLFWCMDDIVSTHKGDDQSPTLLAISNTLISSYLQMLEDRVCNDTHHGDDSIVFDEFDWSLVHANAPLLAKTKLVHALDEIELRTIDSNSNRRASQVSAVRTHLRLLLVLHDRESVQVQKAVFVDHLLEVTDRFGFSKAALAGALDSYVDESEYSPIRLWPTICNVANSFSEIQFDRLLKILGRPEAPFTCLFQLLERTLASHRKDKVKLKISARNVTDEEPYWMPEVFNMIHLAINNGAPEVAHYYLDFARKHSRKAHKNKVDELGAKVELKIIFDQDDYSPDERVQALKEYRVDFDEKSVENEVSKFKVLLIATANIEANPPDAVRMFNNALRSAPNMQNATGLVKAVLALELASGAARLELTDAYSRWRDIYQDLGGGRLSISDLYHVLRLTLRIADFAGFETYWLQATPLQRSSYELIELRFEYLLAVDRREEAIKYVDELRLIHLTLPPGVVDQVESLLVGTQLSKPEAPPTFVYQSETAVRSSLEEKHYVWLEIRNLGPHDQLQVFRPELGSLGEFLLEAVHAVGLELLKRRSNLQRKKLGGSDSVIPLDEENMINDWLVSLLNQRMNYARWTVSDQNRTGASGSGLSVGSADGWIRDGNGNPIMLVEAFRLGKFNKGTVTEHLNKLANYNSAGISPIMVIAYVAHPEFSDQCDQYESFVRSMSAYNGFDSTPGKPLRRMLNNKHCSATVRYYEEMRVMNDNDVTIYHQLLDMRP